MQDYSILSVNIHEVRVFLIVRVKEVNRRLIHLDLLDDWCLHLAIMLSDDFILACVDFLSVDMWNKFNLNDAFNRAENLLIVIIVPNLNEVFALE